MADYQAQIRLGVEGLGQLRQLENRLENAVNLLGRLEQASANVGQVAQASERNVRRADLRRFQAQKELRSAQVVVENVDQRINPRTGRFEKGPNATARRLAGKSLRLAEREAREADRSFREEQQNRRLISAAEQRYARALDRAGNILGSTQAGIGDVQARVDAAMRGIGRESRENYLTNLFGGRQRELRRGGGGRNLSANPAENARLQEQIRQNRAAFDLARGANNLPVMSRLATELSGLVRQQNEFNRIRTGRSVSFESGRRGQEKITELSRMPGADPSRIRRLRGQATEVIAAGYAEDIAGARDATRRMKASIGRYERELNAAATDLANQRRVGIRNLNVRQSWQTALSGMAEISSAGAAATAGRRMNVRQGWQQALAGMADIQSTGRTAETGRRMNVRQGWQKALAELQDTAELIRGRQAATRRSWQQAFAQAQEIGASMQQRQGLKGLNTRQSWTAVLQDFADFNRTRQESLAQAVAANQSSARGRAAELRRTQGLSFEERLARLRPDLAPGAQKAAPGLFRGDFRKALGEGLIGGAFPLLFGQGVGASAGGLAGGLAGGAIGGSFGFGLSLIGTALGSVVDTTSNNLKELASSLKSPNDAIAALEASGFRVGDSLKLQVEQLQSVGRAYDAQTLVLQEVEKRLGTGGVRELSALTGEQRRLEEQWSILAGELQRSIIPGLIIFTSVLGDIVELINGLRADPSIDTSTRNYRFNPFTGQLADIGGRAPNAAQRRLDRARGAAPARPPLSQQEMLAEEKTRIESQKTFIDRAIALNESRKAGNREYASLVREVEDWRRNNEEKIFTMRRQGADIEKEKSNLRLDIENKIFSMRQETARLEIDNARSRAQLAIESFDLELARRSDALGGGGGEFIDQVREYLRVRGQGESELQAKEKIGKLEIAAKERELQQYVLQVTDKVAAINRTVEDYKRDQAKFRFEASRRQEDYRIKVEDYIYNRFKERYEYAIGSEQEILRIRMEAAAQMGAMLPTDVGQMLGGAGMGQTMPGISGLASPVGSQSSGRPVNWNQGLGAGRGHQGQDIGVDVGTTIHAMEDAVVQGIIKGFGKAGDAVILRYANSDKIGVYGHINPGVSVGQRVTAGQQIGLVTPDIRRDGFNNTHLHYELWKRSRGAGGQLLDPTDRLRGAIYNRRANPPKPARSAPLSIPATNESMFERRGLTPPSDSRFNRRSSLPEAGAFDISKIVDQDAFEDVAGLLPLPIKRMRQQAAKEMQKIWRRTQEFSGSLLYDRPTKEEREKARQETLRRTQTMERVRTGSDPVEAEWRQRENNWRPAEQRRSKPAIPSALQIEQIANIYKEGALRNLPRATRLGLGDDVSSFLSAQQKTALSQTIKDVLSKAYTDSTVHGGGAASINKALDKLRPIEKNFMGLMDSFLQSEAAKGNAYAGAAIKQNAGRFRWSYKGSGGHPTASPAEAERRLMQENEEIRYRLQQMNEPPNIIIGPSNRMEGAMLPGGGFNMASLSKLERNYGEFAGPAQLPRSMRVDAPSTVPRDQWRQPTVPSAIPTIPFTGNLPTYAPAPTAAPVAPADPVLPPSPAPMVLPDIRPLTQELSKQKNEIMMSVELMKKLQEVEEGRLLLQLTSTREVRGRLNDAARELFMETEMLGIDKSRSNNEQEIRAEKIRTRMALEDLNELEKLSVGFADDMLKAGKLQQQEYDKIIQGLQDRLVYERELLDIVEQRAEVAREEAFMQRLGDVQRETRLTGAGLRAGLVGTGARAFEEEMGLTGDMDKATQRANAAKALEDQQLIWGRLEQNIVDVSEAISGGLTNGLLDIIDGSRKIEDVGRDVLRSIAGTFAESAQQQLSTLMQRKLAGMLGGPEGMLTRLVGGGTEAAGAQALGMASLTAAGQVAFFGATLRTVAAQMAVSSSLSGVGSAFASAAPSLLGSAIPNLLPGFIPGAFSFGGFFANGGVTSPNKGYVVGDGGEPEFFFPGVTGRVVPRSDMEKAMALQDEGGSSEIIDLRYTVTEERGERYVTEAQFRRSNAMLLARSQAMSYSGMRHNKEVRDYVGI